MNNEKQIGIKDNIFKLVQKFLANPPVIIWGSGATIFTWVFWNGRRLMKGLKIQKNLSCLL